MLIEYETGNLEETEIPGMEWTRVVNDSVLSKECLTKPWLGTQYIGLNNQRWPFTDKLVRQAFNCAIDRQYINDAIFSGRYLLAKGVLPPDIPGYNEELTGYQFNQERARQLLSEAGFVDSDGDGIREKAGRKLEVEYRSWLATPLCNGWRRLWLPSCKKSACGYIKAMDAGPFLDAMEAGRTQMFRLGWLPDYGSGQLPICVFHSRNAGPAGMSRSTNERWTGCWTRLKDSRRERAGRAVPASGSNPGGGCTVGVYVPLHPKHPFETLRARTNDQYHGQICDAFDVCLVRQSGHSGMTEGQVCW